MFDVNTETKWFFFFIFVCLFVFFSLLGIGIFDLILPASNSDKNMTGDDLPDHYIHEDNCLRPGNQCIVGIMYSFKCK